MQSMTRDEWLGTGKALYGEDFMDWKFKCPSCGHVQKVSDFRPFKDAGAKPDTARVQCIGRYNGNMHRPIGSKPGPCNYTSHGLFNLNPIKIIDGETSYSSFAFADELGP